MTRLLVDLLFMDGHKGGMEQYVQSLYRHFPDGAFELVGLASVELISRGAEWFPGELIGSGVSGRNRRAWAQGEVLAVTAAARLAGAQLIHSPANFGPWWGRVPVVLTVHDLLPFHSEYSGGGGTVIRTLVRRAAAHAARILTDSEQSRADIAERLRPRAEVDVIPLAGGSVAPWAATSVRESGLLLAVGNRLPHKNFEALLEAVALIPESRRPHLVITGGGPDDPLRPVMIRLGLEAWVELAGWVTTEQLEALYARAAAVVVPTLFEGFGLPVLEGMARGCPVICSELPVLREVGGGAADYFDPGDPRSIAAAINSTLANPARRAELARLGLERSSGFSWARTAQLTCQSFECALGT
jgi:glycosyltransferase involved in cell wall biosynthesis